MWRRRRGDGVDLAIDATKVVKMRAGPAPCAFGFMRSSVPMTAPAYLSPLAPNKLPSNAVGVKRLNAPRVRALVEAASMIAAAAMRTIVWWVWRVLLYVSVAAP